MAGITIDIQTTGLAELVAKLEAASSDLRPKLEAVLAEQAIAYNQDLRGSGPGVGITPFDTGRLLLSGNIDQQGINLTFLNEAEYAEWVRKSGRPIGDYEVTSGDAFSKRFGDELADLWEAASAEAID